MFICVYGGQYGSEGKGSASEFVTKSPIFRHCPHLTVIGDNGPNSGHTNTLGKVRSMPAASFFADTVLLGPDSVIDPIAFTADLETIMEARRKLQLTDLPTIMIHEHAAVYHDDMSGESEADIVHRIGSTGSGAGIARYHKFIKRRESAIAKSCIDLFTDLFAQVITNDEWFDLTQDPQILENSDYLFECSQGTMLDTNLGRYPYVTSRSTLPAVAVHRNGLGHLPWMHAGVFRTFPIRTGGNTGPCDGREISWEQVCRKPEIASVTGRKRRIFEFSAKEFERALTMTSPTVLFITFCDYLTAMEHPDPMALGEAFGRWAGTNQILNHLLQRHTFISGETGLFYPIGGARQAASQTSIIKG